MTDAKKPLPAERLEAARDKLVKAVARLEQALEARSRRADGESLEAVPEAVVARLDDTIEQLKSVLGR